MGGCVRDSILGKIPNDWDITTNALPEQVLKCFSNYKIIATGLKHGTVTIIIDNEHFEVTTFRIDGKYTDNRRPDNVEFTGNLKDDLSRRDFTINAMAYNTKTGLVDFFGCKHDIENKIISCVGEPDTRFNEDSLRILRALRFASVLGFKIDSKTTQSIHKNKYLLKNIAVERISSELNKLLLGYNAKQILYNFSDVLIEFIPEIQLMIGFNQNNPHHNLDVWEHTIEAVSQSPYNIILRLSMLFHDIAKPLCYTEDEEHIGHFYGHAFKSSDMASIILKRLKYDNYTITTVKELIFYHDTNTKPKKRTIKRLLNKIGEERFKQLIEIKRADIKAHNPKYINDLDNTYSTIDLLNEIIKQQQCFHLKDLKINGKDLIDIGIPKGIQVGVILNKLMDMIIDDDIENDRDKLLNMALEIYNHK